MAIIKINDAGTAVTFIDNDNNQYGTSLRWLQGLLIGKAPNNFVELHMYPNKAPEGKWRKSPVFENGVKIPFEEYFKDKEQSIDTPDLMDKKVRESKRRKDAFKVDDNVW